MSTRTHPRRWGRVVSLPLGVLTVLVLLLRETDDGFRFIWHAHEGELTLFVVITVWIALALLATGGTHEPVGRTSQRLVERRGVRFVSYLGVTMVIPSIAFVLGVGHFEATECSGDAGGECDLAAIGGAVWAAGALIICLMVAIAIETAWTVRRQQHAPHRSQQ